MRYALRFSSRLAALLAIVSFVAPAAASAGGPLAVCRPGVPFLWPGGGLNIPWNPDQGPLGPLTNSQAIDQVAQAFAAWDVVPSASTTYLQGGPLPVDVDITNFLDYLIPSSPDGLSAIVFDDSGAIFNALFGPNSGVLGFAGPEWLDPTTCEIVEGVSFLNGPTFGNAAVALDVMVHEFGHYQNLAHTVVNGQILLGDTSGPTPFDTFPLVPLAGLIETMYPFYFGTAAGTSTPHKDDAAMLSTLYPDGAFFASTGTITGRILASNGTTPKTGFNVIARNVANPFADAVSAISSDFTDNFTPGAPLVGVYTLRGLTPGAQYAVFVDGILDGGFSTPPGILPGPEEFYSGAAESNLSATDPPNEFEPVAPVAGAPTGGIDIIFNGFLAGDPLPLADDSAVELALPFGFGMCGTTFETLVVNANGTVSFGEANSDFSESVPEFLAGPPQIAGAWDDLHPGAGGSVYFNESVSQFTVTFEAVPERTGPFSGVGSNTFSITLKRGNEIDIRYGGLTMTDGLAGVSCGGAVTSGLETPVDLSEQVPFRINMTSQPAVFERFFSPTPTSPGSPNDLDDLTLRFTTTTRYRDTWAEPNDTLARARRIALPFLSADVNHITEISGPNDVDFFRFSATAGQVIVAQLIAGQIDSVLGLYDAGGTLLAVDDDSGAGVLSRIEFTIPQDGDYAVAVSTFPDFQFDGGGSGGTGRYVLDVHEQPATSATNLLQSGGFGDPAAASVQSRFAATAPPGDRRDTDSRRLVPPLAVAWRPTMMRAG